MSGNLPPWITFGCPAKHKKICHCICPPGPRGPPGQEGPEGPPGPGNGFQFPCEQLKRKLEFTFNSTQEEVIAVVAPSPQFFGTEGRIGGPPTFEQDIGVPDTSTPVVTGENPWVNGTAKSFTLEYETATGTITWILNGITQNWVITPNQIPHIIGIRGRAVSNPNSVRRSEIVINIASVESFSGTTIYSTCPRLTAGFISEHEIIFSRLEIPSLLVMSGIRVTGDVTISWPMTMPTQSQAAIQFKVGTGECYNICTCTST